MSTVGNDTTGASGTGPASGYNLVLSHLFIVFFLFLYRLSVNTSNPIMLLIFTYSMICFMIFGIKICRKMSKNLTRARVVCRGQAGEAGALCHLWSPSPIVCSRFWSRSWSRTAWVVSGAALRWARAGVRQIRRHRVSAPPQAVSSCDALLRLCCACKIGMERCKDGLLPPAIQ
jgi:hypothetical protein